MSGARRRPAAPRAVPQLDLDRPQAAPVVDQYLDVLLREATEAPLAPPAAGSLSRGPDPIQPPTPAPAPAPAPAAMPVPAPAVAGSDAPAAVGIAPPSASPAPAARCDAPAGPLLDAPHAWAAQPFQALEFDLGELRLAVPLVGLRRILSWRGEIRRLPGSPPWLLGLYERDDERVRVCDLARVIDFRRKIDASPASGGHLLILDGSDWACWCTALGEVRRVEPEQVEWGEAGASPPWRCGAVRDGLRSLVDPVALGRLLQQRGSGRRGSASGAPSAADI